LFSLSAAAKNLHVTWSIHGSGAVNITCKAQGVYPEPKMALYRDNKNKYVSRASFLEFFLNKYLSGCLAQKMTLLLRK
jgi:hypothetical protein